MEKVGLPNCSPCFLINSSQFEAYLEIWIKALRNCQEKNPNIFLFGNGNEIGRSGYTEYRKRNISIWSMSIVVAHR
jgi:hypothetical protein